MATTNKGERTTSLSLASVSKNEAAISGKIPQICLPETSFSKFEHLKPAQSKNIFYFPAMFNSQPRLSTLDNIVKGRMSDNETINVEIILAADYNESVMDQYSISLVIEKSCFPYEFSLSDELTLSNNNDLLVLNPTYTRSG